MCAFKVAVVGSGVSGLSAAHFLNPKVSVSLFEAQDYFGGHARTVDVRLTHHNGEMHTHGVDTGFLVFNEKTYPGLIGLFKSLGVDVAKSDMTFSVQAHSSSPQEPTLEWCGSNLNGLFAQRKNIWSPAFLGMVWEILRFNRVATQCALEMDSAQSASMPAWKSFTVQDFLEHHAFSASFQDLYLLPMLGSIWSCPTQQMLAFPVSSMISFCHNHGLLQVMNRPQWYTVRGGSKHYVEKIIQSLSDTRLSTPVRSIKREAHRVVLNTDQGQESFDAVLLATHAPEALRLLEDPDPRESDVLGAIRTQDNEAVLHTDESVMPRLKRAWAAWNFESTQRSAHELAPSRVCLHYWINRLQPLPFREQVFVSMNPLRRIDPSKVLGRFHYAHPIFDLPAVSAQAHIESLQGLHRTWYAGAWMGYGFHEDGFSAGKAAAQSLLQALAGPMAP
jgi:uncharacterized protein